MVRKVLGELRIVLLRPFVKLGCCKEEATMSIGIRVFHLCAWGKRACVNFQGAGCDKTKIFNARVSIGKALTCALDNEMAKRIDAAACLFPLPALF